MFRYIVFTLALLPDMCMAMNEKAFEGLRGFRSEGSTSNHISNVIVKDHIADLGNDYNVEDYVIDDYMVDRGNKIEAVDQASHSGNTIDTGNYMAEQLNNGVIDDYMVDRGNNKKIKDYITDHDITENSEGFHWYLRKSNNDKDYFEDHSNNHNNEKFIEYTENQLDYEQFIKELDSLDFPDHKKDGEMILDACTKKRTVA